MRLEHEFRVEAPTEAVWGLLLDVERVAPCLPGAQVAERVDDRTYEVEVTVKLGPMRLNYRGEVAIVEADEAARRTVMEAKATDVRGQGTARATITTTLSPDGTGTRADVETDLQLTGRVAQMGRGIVLDVSNRLLAEFSDCVSRKAAARGAAAEEPVAASAISSTGLLWDLVKTRLRRLFRRG